MSNPTERTLPMLNGSHMFGSSAVGAEVIVFDEPTSSLNGEEAEKLFAIIDKLKRDGCAIIYISHKMEEILRISDTVTVMRDGTHIATKPASELTTDAIIKLVNGHDLNGLDLYCESSDALKERFPTGYEAQNRINSCVHLYFKKYIYDNSIRDF